MSKKYEKSGPPGVKIIIDTNLWISFIISSRQQELVLNLFKYNIVVYTCTERIEELKDVLQRDKMRRYLKQPVDEYISFHEKIAKKTSIKSTNLFSMDPKDSFLLDLSIEARRRE